MPAPMIPTMKTLRFRLRALEQMKLATKVSEILTGKSRLQKAILTGALQSKRDTGKMVFYPIFFSPLISIVLWCDGYQTNGLVTRSCYFFLKMNRSRKRSCKKNGNTESTSLDDDLSQEESGEESGSISGEGCSTSGRQKRRKQLIHDSSEDEDDNQDDNAVMALAVLTRNRRRLAVERSAGGGVVEELVSG